MNALAFTLEKEESFHFKTHNFKPIVKKKKNPECFLFNNNNCPSPMNKYMSPSVC